MMNVLMTMSGTGARGYTCQLLANLDASWESCDGRGQEKVKGKDILLISVLTLAISWMIFAFTDWVSCWPPKPGDCGVVPQPTVQME